MSTPPIKINDSLFCLANDWEKGKHRYSLELSKTEDPKNTILVVGVNPGGKTDPEEKHIGRTIRRVCDLVIDNGEGDTKYDSALFVNLTPKIAITPSGLKDSEGSQDLPKDNVEEIKALIQGRKGRISNVLFWQFIQILQGQWFIYKSHRCHKRGITSTRIKVLVSGDKQKGISYSSSCTYKRQETDRMFNQSRFYVFPKRLK